jgi:8-oxo-dGTP diphosphatase
MDDLHRISARVMAAFRKPALAPDFKDEHHQFARRVKTRRRGTALVETDQGILLVSEDGLRFSLPGGAAEKDELWIQAAIRELHEETGLVAFSARYLFSHMGDIRRRNGGYSRNHHKVFLIEAEGIPKPLQEIEVIHFYQAGDDVKLSNSTQIILEKYRALKLE